MKETLKEMDLLRKVLKLRHGSSKQQKAAVSFFLQNHVNTDGDRISSLQVVCRVERTSQLHSSPIQNVMVHSQRYYRSTTKWWDTPNMHIRNQDVDEDLEGDQTLRPNRILGSTIIAQFKSKLDNREHFDWTRQEWDNFETQVLEEKQELGKIWEAVCMKFLLHFALTDAGISLLDYIRSKGRSPNIATLTTFIALCGKYGGKRLQGIVFESYEELLKQTNVFDTGSCKCLIDGLSGTDRWRETLDLLEMTKISQQPTTRFYSPIAVAAFREGEFSTGFELMEIMGQEGLMPQSKVLLMFVQACTLTSDMSSMVTFFEKCRKYLWFPADDVVKCIEQFFLSVPGSQNGTWQSSWTTVNNRGICNACGHKMPRVELSSEDFKELQETFLETALVSGNVFLKTSPGELEEFTVFIRSTAPYDIILDSLNIAFRQNIRTSVKQKVEMLLQVVEHFVKKKKVPTATLR